MKYFESEEYFHAATHMDIQDKLQAFSEEFDSKFCDTREYVESYEIDHYADTIDIITSLSSCGCCRDDTEYYYLPLSYLWDENWIEARQEIVKQETATRKKQEEERRAAEAVRSKERRYERYLELQKEFAE